MPPGKKVPEETGMGSPTPTPRLLFFTGGTALRDLSRFLALTNPNTIHIVTTFDSGGSTAEFRRCFAIPAMGDLRNRLLALSDPYTLSPRIMDFFERRLPFDADATLLRSSLASLARGDDPFWEGVAYEDAAFLQQALSWMLAALPPDFILQGASLGNIILASVYLQNGRDFAPTLAVLSTFLRVRGLVVPVVDESLHLGCELEDGTLLLGQHHFKSLPSPIRGIFLSVHDPRAKTPALDVCRPRLSRSAENGIALADVICYPMGSFFSSVLVNLLVRGVPERVAARSCPKIFLPNLGCDPELGSLRIARQVELLLDIMHRDAPFAENSDFLSAVLIDSQNGDYGGRLHPETRETLAEMGIRLLDRPLTKDGFRHDPKLTVSALTECLREGFF